MFLPSRENHSVSDSSLDEEAPETFELIKRRKRRRRADMEAETDHRMAKRYNLLNDLAAVLGILDVVLVVTWIFKYSGGLSWGPLATRFNWHPLLMVLGFFFIHSQSILIYRRARFLRKTPLKYAHAVLHLVAFVSAVIALVAVFDSHNLAIPPKPNLYSFHSWMGLSAVILFAAQFLLGLVTFLYPGLASPIRSLYLPIHTKFGHYLFIMTTVSVVTGLYEKAIWIDGYDQLPGQAVLLNIACFLTVAFGGLVLYLVGEDSYKRVAVADDQIALVGN